MFPRRFKLFDAFGIPVYLDFSFLLLLVLFVLDGSGLLSGVRLAVLLFAAITCHELGHALTARAFGYRASDITLSLIGGCARFASLPRKAYQEFLVAAAGPAVSFALAALAYVAFSVCGDALRGILAVFFWLNLTLELFNLLPGFPMDGGRIFRSALRLFANRSEATLWAMWVGRGVAAVLVFGPLFGLHRIGPIWLDGNLILRFFIAWMIWREGYAEYRRTLEEESWGARWEYSARVSGAPYDDDDDGDDVEVRER